MDLAHNDGRGSCRGTADYRAVELSRPTKPSYHTGKTVDPRPDAVRRSLAKRPIAGGRPNVLKRIVSMMLAAVAAMADHIGDRIGEAKVGTARG